MHCLTFFLLPIILPTDSNRLNGTVFIKYITILQADPACKGGVAAWGNDTLLFVSNDNSTARENVTVFFSNVCFHVAMRMHCGLRFSLAKPLSPIAGRLLLLCFFVWPL